MPETQTENQTTSQRYLLLLPGPEEEWADLPQSEMDAGMANHRRFHEQLAARGHQVVTAGPLDASSQAISMRNTGRGSATVTAGPFTGSAEQILGFYLLETSDPDDLIAVVTEFAEGGDHVELRRIATD